MHAIRNCQGNLIVRPYGSFSHCIVPRAPLRRVQSDKTEMFSSLHFCRFAHAFGVNCMQ